MIERAHSPSPAVSPRLGWSLTALAVLLGLGGGLAWLYLTTPSAARTQARLARMHSIRDLPTYPGALPDPMAPALPRGPVQTAIYLTDATPDQVKAFYRRKLGLPDDVIRELPSAWVTDLPKEHGERFTIQAEAQPSGLGTRVSVIHVDAAR